jgi:hypothetical protein
MKVPYGEGPEIYTDAESCLCTRTGIGQAVERRSGAGLLSRETYYQFQGTDAVCRSGRQHRLCRYREMWLNRA